MTLKNRFFQLAWIISLFAIAGCSAIENLQAPPDCSDETALFRDDFNADESCDWAQYTSGGESVQIADGALQIQTSSNGIIAWTNPQGNEFADSEVTVQARQISGPNNNAYGVICRYVDEENFYVFLISGDGYYAIGKYISGEAQIQYLTGEAPEHYVQSDRINQGVAQNRVQARCVGDQLSLIVNGFLLDQISDSSHLTGNVGLAATTFEPGISQIEFDNVVVEAP